MSNIKITKALAIDCEMVGAGPKGRISLAARVSLVNEYGQCIFDFFIKPDRKVTDYRTPVSGITPGHLSQGRPFDTVKREVVRLIKGRILVGHSVDKDLRVLGLSHPKANIRDTAVYPPFRTQKGTPSLKFLAEKHLGWAIQTGEHSSVEDAKAVMKIYKKVEHDWEAWLCQPYASTDSESDESEECYYGGGTGHRCHYSDEDDRCYYDYDYGYKYYY